MATIKPTTYTVYPDGYDDAVNSDKYLWTLRVECTVAGDGKTWAVRNMFGRCINRKGECVYEPIPSSRTTAWLKSHRFPLGEALTIASKAVEGLTVNRTTLAEASNFVADRNAGREG